MATLLWLVLPYLAFLSFVLGHVRRFRLDRFGWDTAASWRHSRRMLRTGTVLFNVGVLVSIGAHLLEFFIAESGARSVVVSEVTRDALLRGIELIAALIGTAGAGIQLTERIHAPRARDIAAPADRLVFPLLAVGLLLGIAVRFAPDESDSNYLARETLYPWFHSLFTFGPKPELMANAPMLCQGRALFVLVVFGVWPFTRLVGVFVAPWRVVIRSLRRIAPARDG